MVRFRFGFGSVLLLSASDYHDTRFIRNDRRGEKNDENIGSGGVRLFIIFFLIFLLRAVYISLEQVKLTSGNICRHYTNRAIVPPAETVLTDLYTPSLPTDPAQPNHQRHTYAAFPLPVIARGLDVQVLEPDYIACVSPVLFSLVRSTP